MTRNDISLRRVGLAMLLLFMTYTPTVFSQSLTVFDIDASAYPVMRAKFYAFDASGNQLTGIAPSDLQLRENGIDRTVTRVSCPPVSLPLSISSVLTIDKSSSMEGAGIQVAKAAARAWIGVLSLGRSECAVTSFDDRAVVNQDFTTDRTALLKALDELRLGIDNDFDAAFLNPPGGALEVCKRGQHKKVILFLSDGIATMLKETEIIAEARRQNVTIHAVMVDTPTEQSVRNICFGTGGLYFEHITTEAEATDIILRILQSAQGGAPCEMEWMSAGCDTTRTLEMMLYNPLAAASTHYVLSSSMLPGILYTPSRYLRFGEVAPGTVSEQQIVLTGQGSAQSINRVSVNNPRFSILDYGGSPPPFTLGAGQSRTLTVQYAPVDSSYAFCRIEVEGDACHGTSFYAYGGWRWKQAARATVRVVHPNGGERLAAGSEAELIWEGVMPEDTVRLDYSVDGGVSWQHISDEATGLRHAWRVPKQPSDSCLLRVTADSRWTLIGDMALIPAGTFRMGNITDHPDGDSIEIPVHDVTITRPFLMSRTEVTQETYQAVMGSNPSWFKGPDLPVELVTWYEAVEFCNELSRLEGLDTCYSGSAANIVCDFTARGYRLPTEAEWEYACRAGTETDFYTGNMTVANGLDPALDRAGWYYDNSSSPAHRGSTHPVGEKEPNAFGLYDMHGNALEWCWDWYADEYYASSPAHDPRGPASGNARVFRSGSFDLSAKSCRSASRVSLDPDLRSNGRYFGGFRVVRTY